MEHLQEDYGIKIGPDLQVDYTARNEFSHNIGPPRSKADFHKFPTKLGWQLDLNYKLDIMSVSSQGITLPSPHSLDTLLTAWLFFGLISAIVQKNGQPILEDKKLQSGGWLHTKALKAALREWADWELENPSDLWARMIQAEYVLEKARKVVRKNCGYDVERDCVEYHTKKEEVARYLTDQKAMALMTLGETLWQVKVSIMQEAEMKHQKLKISLEGWHTDDDDGWGPPRWVFKQMRKYRWCPRAVRLLKGQLRSNATLLLQAYSAYKDTDDMIYSNRHSKCTIDMCEAKTLNNENEYSPQCLPDCPDRDRVCQMIGPDMEVVRRILASNEDNATSHDVSDVPVLKFTSQSDGTGVKLEVTALPKRDRLSFATVSHVWSDGWGNEKANSLHTCQLGFIRRQLQRLNEGNDVFFWMDTLLVPVKEGPLSERDKAIKKKAIRQIFDVFEHSTYTIVLDNGLCASSPPMDLPTQTAMMILASGWMRRLWTLQEAFLSHKLHFVFKESNVEPNHTANLINLDDLNEKLAQVQPIRKLYTPNPPPAGTVRGMLDRNIMGQERQARNYSLGNGDQIQPKKAALLVASAWFAARWRTTSNSAHETLALATLLNLKYGGTIIEDAGLTKRENMTNAFMEELVCQFWKTFHKTYRHAIPPGIIFLPGEKIKKSGYGWAPKTWMSADEVDYPNPLDSWSGETDLQDDDGLRVKYPGFLLHTIGKDSRMKVLSMTQDSHIRFPADRSLIEWYNVKPADSNQNTASFPPGIVDDNTQLAIILSRPRPVASPPEIGLLVEIYSTAENKIVEGDGRTTRPQVFSCHMIRRVHVWREMLTEFLAGPELNGPELHTTDHNIAANTTRASHWEIIGGPLPASDLCLGETIPPDQPWLVDGYQLARKCRSAGRPDVPGIKLDEARSSDVSSWKGWKWFLVPGRRQESGSVERKGALLPEAQKQKQQHRSLTYPSRDESSAAPSPTPGLRHQRTNW